MPIALIIVAAILFIVGVRGNYQDAGQLLNDTFYGSNGQSGFLGWFGSIVGLAVLFRVIGAPRAGELFIALLLVVFVLQNPGVLAAIESAIQTGSQAPAQSTAGGNSATPVQPVPNWSWNPFAGLPSSLSQFLGF